MKLYYCLHCNSVFVFDDRDIRKHDLERVADKGCRVCEGACSMVPLPLSQLIKEATNE